MPPSDADKARALLEATLREYVDRPAEALGAPQEIKPALDSLLARVDTYRDGALTLLAFPVALDRVVDLTGPKLTGARGVAQYTAILLETLAIPGRQDALQTLAKGAPTYMGRSRKQWNELLEWASSQADSAPIAEAWRYLAAGIARTARTIPPLPDLDTPRLTFPALVGLIDELLSLPSAGAHEQFSFAAFLEAWVGQLSLRKNERVSTKSLNASDASASAAGDVQHLAGGQVLEAYEITAARWELKVDQAIRTLRRYDLARVHIVAVDACPTGQEIAKATGDPRVDLSVLDLGFELRSLTHRLLKPGRRFALERLYDHLTARQPQDDLVVNLVELLRQRGLTSD